MGKTHLAAEFARTQFATKRLDVLVWIIASSRQGVEDGLANAALELLGIEPDGHAAQRLLAWLQPSESRPMCRWLVVLDDVADPRDLAGLWPPSSPHGFTLVTTRRRDPALAGPERPEFQVGLFTKDEACAFLRARLNQRADDLGRV